MNAPASTPTETYICFDCLCQFWAHRYAHWKEEPHDVTTEDEDERTVCETCFHKFYSYCDGCRKDMALELLHDARGQRLCEDCDGEWDAEEAECERAEERRQCG